MGVSLLCTGAIAEAQSHLDLGISLYDPSEHRQLATRFGVDAGVSILSYRSWALWMLGYPEAAITDVERALKGARDIGHAAVLMYALGHASFTYMWEGNHPAARVLLDELAALADEKSAAQWRAFAILVQGWIFGVSGRTADALQMITAGINAWRSPGATVYLPLHLSHLTRAYAELGQFADAQRCVGEAITAIETSKERWYEAEVHRIAGEIALKSPEPDAGKGEGYFEHALTVARQQQAKSWELRAAMSMARLWCDQGKRKEALDLLAPVYGWFTEGHDTLDLKEAKALLEELAA
jgi:predicted ATPase